MGQILRKYTYLLGSIFLISISHAESNIPTNKPKAHLTPFELENNLIHEKPTQPHLYSIDYIEKLKVNPLPNTNLYINKAKTQYANGTLSEATTSELEGVNFDNILDLMVSTTDINFLVSKDINANIRINWSYTNIPTNDVIKTLLDSQCLSSERITGNLFHIYKDAKKTDCSHTENLDSYFNINPDLAKPITIDNITMPAKTFYPIIVAGYPKIQYGYRVYPIINSIMDADKTNYKLLTIQATEKPAKDILTSLLKVSCHSYRTIDNSPTSLMVYNSATLPDCNPTLQPYKSLAKLSNFEKSINIQNEAISLADILRELDKVTNYGYITTAYNAFTAPSKLDPNKRNPDLEIDLNQKYKINTDNQPAYKIAQAILKSQCLGFSKLDGNILYLAKDPKNTTCQPAPAGSEIIIK